jgi:iron complex outermembrane receptor protein
MRLFTHQRLAILSLLLLSFFVLQAQGQDISGKISDGETGEPVAGANISIKGTVMGTITDTNGDFTLKSKGNYPITLIISFVGYKTHEVVVNQAGPITPVELRPSALLAEEVVVTASRVEESVMKSPVAVEKLDTRALKETPAPSFYDAIESVKGVQMTTLSLGFKVPNTRGFTNTTNARFLQMVDGADTQAPGLGVSIANTVGPTELDIESIEITPGASSALYGLNALNGISNLITKSPFVYQGLSAYQKVGVNHVNDKYFNPQLFTESALRYAKAFNNKFAFKINLGYLKGTDWVADNQRDLNPKANESTGLLGADNPAKDPVNSYGNENSYRRTLALGDGKSYEVRRTGYEERYLTNNYKLNNPKLDLALHYRLTQNLEASYTYHIGQTDAIYQRGNRIRLEDYQIQQHKVEIRGANYFIRSYLTSENTTKSYNLGPAGGAMDKSFKSDNDWYKDYTTQYNASIANGLSAAESHRAARAFADNGRFQPGTAAFDAKLKQLATINNWDIGDQLILQNKLVHLEGQYDFTGKVKFADILVGADTREFIIKPDGNSFINPDKDNPNATMYYSKVGGFAQIAKRLFGDKLKITGSVRVDKTKYFDPKVNPRISAVYTLKDVHNFRLSVQNGYRFPTIFEGFSAINNGGVIRYGGIDILTKDLRLFENSYVRSSADAFQKAVLNDINKNGKTKSQAILDNQGLLVQNTYTYLKPEEITAFDLGYKSSLLNNTLYIDVDGYYNIYQNFIDQIEINVPKKGQVGVASSNGIDSTVVAMNDKSQYTTYRMWTNAKSKYFNYGASLGVSYNFFKKYTLSGNYSYAKLEKIDAKDKGLETPFNTPRHIVNLSFSNREVIKNLGFSVAWRWQTSFVWKSQLANGTVPAYQTIDAQVTYRVPSLFSTVKVGGSNIFNREYYQYIGGPTIGALYYVSITVDGLLRK